MRTSACISYCVTTVFHLDLNSGLLQQTVNIISNRNDNVVSSNILSLTVLIVTYGNQCIVCTVFCVLIQKIHFRSARSSGSLRGLTPFREEQRDGDPRSACREDSESPATRRGNSLHCKAAFYYHPTNRTTQGERWSASDTSDGRRRKGFQSMELTGRYVVNDWHVSARSRCVCVGNTHTGGRGATGQKMTAKRFGSSVTPEL